MREVLEQCLYVLVEPGFKPSAVVPLEVDLVVVDQNRSSQNISPQPQRRSAPRRLSQKYATGLQPLVRDSSSPANQGPQLRALDVSGTTGPTGPDPPTFHYGRNFSFPAGVTEHPLHPLLALQNVDVFERDSVFLEVLTGLISVRSGVLAENQHFFLHGASRFCIT